MRVAILWTGLSGYINTCMQELGRRQGIEIMVCHRAASNEAPFEADQFQWLKNRVTWHSKPDEELLRKKLTEFSPDVLIFTGWFIPAYCRMAREFAGKCLRVMTMDNCWQATLKQWAGVLSAPRIILPLADAVWVPGERQAVFARKMGFEQVRILRGLYAGDQQRLGKTHLARVATKRPVPHCFIFVGRFVAVKGLKTLVTAYRKYRATQSQPWPLVCCGTGPLVNLLERQDGICVEGFVQPEQLPEVFATTGCLVLPSSFEPWAVVVHEAASAGLLVLASEKVGAAVHLVQPGYNGFICSTGDAEELAEQMARISAMSDERLDHMSHASYGLSQQFSPLRWADTILDAFDAWKNKRPATSNIA